MIDREQQSASFVTSKSMLPISKKYFIPKFLNSKWFANMFYTMIWYLRIFPSPNVEWIWLFVLPKNIFEQLIASAYWIFFRTPWFFFPLRRRTSCWRNTIQKQYGCLKIFSMMFYSVTGRMVVKQSGCPPYGFFIILTEVRNFALF